MSQGVFQINRRPRSNGEGEFIDITTPVVESVFPRLLKPDRPKKDGKYLEGSKLTYNIDVDVLETEAAELMELVAELKERAKSEGHLKALELAKKRAKKEKISEKEAYQPLPYYSFLKLATDRDRQERPGYIRLGFKMDAVREKDGVKTEQRPMVFAFDKDGKVVGYQGPEIRTGAMVQVRGSVNVWVTDIGCGVSLRLNSVLIHTTGPDSAQREAESFAKAAGGHGGFAEKVYGAIDGPEASPEEDGYTGPAEAPATEIDDIPF